MQDVTRLDSDSMRWLHPGMTVEEVSALSRDILQTELHPSAVTHLLEDYSTAHVAFPRLENHVTYLFGTLFIPSNVDNPSADFDCIVFAATHDAVIARICAHSTSERDLAIDQRELFNIDTTDETPDGGQFILNALTMVTRDLIADARTILDYLRRASAEVLGGIDLTQSLNEIVNRESLTTRERRVALRQVNDILPAVTGIVAEIPTMRRIANETSTILESLINDDPSRDLHVDLSGNHRELFSRHLEIYLIDCSLDARQLLAMLDEIGSICGTVLERSRQLGEEENVAAGRFTGAIASIMLLPTFIVGLYGQNFAEMPETDWRYGYLFSWGSIVLLTVFQVLFFRKRRWI